MNNPAKIIRYESRNDNPTMPALEDCRAEAGDARAIRRVE
jgi:hypothetical protein